MRIYFVNKHTVQDVYKVASKNPAYTQFWCQHSSVRPKHFKNPHPLPAKDGLLVTGASQDHFVGFHHLTILTGQGDIKEFLVKWKLFSVTNVAIRLAFLVVLSKMSFQSFCLAENFATIKAGSLPSGAHRLLGTEELAHFMQNRALSFLRGNVDIVYAFFTQYFIPFYHFLGR